MSMNDAALWQEIDALLDEALDLPPQKREAHVRQRAGGNADLAQRVLQLLQASDESNEFLETGPLGEDDKRGPPLSRDEPPQLQGQIGPWEILALLGRGGMGEVYKARRNDGVYQQVVALKLLRVDLPEQLQRFESERQILANLNHPGLARLIDGGLSADGRPYMAMEFVQGRTLGQWLQQEQPSLQLRLHLVLELCQAINYAHQQLIVHRDIKPDNIMVDDNGQPRLLDFGIAKINPGQFNQEHTEALATPNYAAPEQLNGQTITTATDVYGLGASLYFSLCGQPPIQLQGLSLPQVLDTICHQEPTPPSRRVSSTDSVDLSGDLDAICSKALARDPQQRYESIAAFAADIQRHLNHQPIAARPPNWLYRSRKWIRRHAVVSGALLAVAASLIAGLGLATWQAHQATQQRDLARREAARLSTMRGAMLQLFRSAANELDTSRLSARDLFSQSTKHIERDFGDDPATAAGLMQMLGELQLFTEDYAAARELLQRAYQLAPSDMPEDILANIRIDLAHLAYREGDYAQAKALYQQADEVWQKQPERYPTERIWGATLASQLARAEGHTDQAVAYLQRAAVDARQHWGAEHQETGVVLINLAVALYYDNRVPDALDACADAWAVWQAIGRDNSPDALNLLANWGLFALRYGRAWEGEKRLSAALELRTQLYGASAAQATLMKNLGVAHRLNGRRNAGMRLLEQGEWMASKYAGAGGRLHASAVYALSRALIDEGLSDEAKTMLKESLQHADDKPFSWRYLNQAVLASLMQQDTERLEAETRFSATLLGLASIGRSALSQLADAQALKAHWLQGRGQTQDALNWLNKAIASKTQARRQGHFEVIRMNDQKVAMLQALGQTKAADTLAQVNRQNALQELGDQHPLSQGPQGF
ncbi:MAG: protein kinase domain-containing protein [Oceanococcus sp.]